MIRISKNLFAIALLAVATLAFTTPAENVATGWSIDKSHSKIAFQVRHFFTPVNGSFDDYTADITFDPATPETGSIDVTIQVASINTANKNRDGHLQTNDFFNAEAYPTITFKSNDIKKSGDNTFVANGKLTIRDVTKDIALPFTLLGTMDHPFRPGTKLAGIVASLKLNRNDYGVGTGDWVATTVVGDEVTVNLNLELNSK